MRVTAGSFDGACARRASARISPAPSAMQLRARRARRAPPPRPRGRVRGRATARLPSSATTTAHQLERRRPSTGVASAPIGVWQPPPSASTTARSASSAAAAAGVVDRATTARARASSPSRISIATMPWPGAGTHASAGSVSEMRDAEARAAAARPRPARAHRTRPSSSLRSRVSRLPRIGANRAPGNSRAQLRDAPHAARADRRRLARARRSSSSIDVGRLRPARVAPLRAARPRRADPRAAARRRSPGRRAAPPACPCCCGRRGRSSPRSSASSISLTNSRLPPTSESGASCSRSPDVLMTTMRQGGPPACGDARGDGVRLPQRQLAAARAEPELARHAHVSASASGARERLDAAAVALERGASLSGPLALGRRRARTAASSASAYAPTVSGVAERLELLGRRQQQLLDDEVRDLVDARPRLGRQRRQLELEPLELRAADRLEPLPQRDDGRDRAARAEPAAELLDFLGDDRLGARDLARAPREVLAHRRLQVVDVVEEHLLDFAGRRPRRRAASRCR